MSIIEHREGLGSFSIDLEDGLPPSVARQLRVSRADPKTKGYGLVVVTPQRVNPADFPAPADPHATIHPLLEVARWSGVLRTVSNRGRTLEGQGLESMLTDADGVGTWVSDLTDLVIEGEALTLVAWLLAGGTLYATNNDPVDFPESHLRIGDLANVTTECRISDLRDVRGLLRQISFQTGQRYRVDAQGRFHWGHPNDVYGGSPRLLIGSGLPGDSDPRWPTLRLDFDDWAETTDGYFAGMIADSPTTSGGTATSPGAWSTTISTVHYHSPLKNMPYLGRKKLDADTDEPYTRWINRANLLTIGASFDQWTASLSGTLTRDPVLIPGEPVYLWDAELGIEDPANTITYGGQQIRPQRVDLISTTWEPRQGMGVYLLYCDTSFGVFQRVLDLTDHVDLTTDPTVEVEVGRPAPTL